MVRRKPSIAQADTMTEDERSAKGGFFSNWFGAPSRTETRDDSDYSANSGSSSDSIDDQYPNNNRRERRRAELSESFESDVDFDTADEDSLADFDRDLRVRHGQACKYMRVRILMYAKRLHVTLLVNL